MTLKWYKVPNKEWPDARFMRDSQRSKVYGAEDALVRAYKDERLETTDEIYNWVAKLSSRKWFKKRFPMFNIERFVVKSGRGRRTAYGGHTHIAMPKWSRNKMIILHELAHCLNVTGHDSRYHVAHGRRYCRIYLSLVKHAMGTDRARELRQRFKQYKVKYSLGRRLTSAQREAARQRCLKNQPLLVRESEKSRS